MPYRIQYSAEAVNHLRLLTAGERATLVDAVEKQLAYEPSVETRNRKRMRPNPVAPWELRAGIIRVYYDIVETPEPTVFIRAIGVKRRSQVVIGGEVMDL
jgi:mRNA-degrading endonuclease RelE of RelBE toxin-antitoxin system